MYPVNNTLVALKHPDKLIKNNQNTYKLPDNFVLLVSRDILSTNSGLLPEIGNHIYIASAKIAKNQQQVVEQKIINRLVNNSLFSNDSSFDLTQVVKLANLRINNSQTNLLNSVNSYASILAAMLTIFSILGDSLQKAQEWQKDFMQIVSLLQSYATDVAGKKQKQSQELSAKHAAEMQKAVRKGGIWELIMKVAIAVVTTVFTAPIAPYAAGLAVFSLTTQMAGSIAKIIDPKSALDPNSKIQQWSKNGIFCLADYAHDGLGSKVASLIGIVTMFTGPLVSATALYNSSATSLFAKVVNTALIADKGVEAGSSVYSVFDNDSKWATYGSMGAAALIIHFALSATKVNQHDIGKIIEIVICSLASLATGAVLSYQLRKTDPAKMEKLMLSIQTVSLHLNLIGEVTSTGNRAIQLENSLRISSETKFAADAELLENNNQILQSMFKSYIDIASEINPQLLKFMQDTIDLIRQTGQIFDDVYRVKH